jgi:CIC family chloride channel protein
VSTEIVSEIVNERGEMETEDRNDLIVLALLSLGVGAVTGLLCALLRLILEKADLLRGSIISQLHDHVGVLGLFLLVALTAGAVALAAWLVRRFSPDAVGSGIPQVEVALNSDRPESPLRHAWVKFIGSIFAIGSGLALGREGPSIQMGAAIADTVGRVFRRSWSDNKVLFAAGAGAGLATAFNAPIAGAIFVLEELLRRFEKRSAIAALGASAGAIGVARMLIGVSPDFHIELQPFYGIVAVPIYIGLGILVGFTGVAYSRAILGALTVADRLSKWPVELRAGVIGAVFGAIAWYAPSLVGGGDSITQSVLDGRDTFATVALIFLLRFILGPVSYAAGVPGGLFAPMLVLGAQTGLLFGIICNLWLPELNLGLTAYAVVGMAAFFTAVVRAPVTGIALAVEMTGSAPLLLPMIAASFASMLIAGLFRVPPIYDSLLQRIKVKI